MSTKRLFGFQVLSQRYLKTSIVITTNRGVAAWGDSLGGTTAMLNRLLYRSVVINLDGDSCGLRDHQARTDTLHRAATGNRNRYLDHAHRWRVSASTPGGFRREPSSPSTYDFQQSRRRSRTASPVLQ
jgi:hypothetical protein